VRYGLFPVERFFSTLLVVDGPSTGLFQEVVVRR
jgi:hypothetical protein